jgi:hypothetical protein
MTAIHDRGVIGLEAAKAIALRPCVAPDVTIKQIRGVVPIR